LNITYFGHKIDLTGNRRPRIRNSSPALLLIHFVDLLDWPTMMLGKILPFLLAATIMLSPQVEARSFSVGGLFHKLTDIEAAFHRHLSEVDPSAEYAYQKRQEINDMYGLLDTKKYGHETRTIVRYIHPDGKKRNLCVRFEAGQVFNYTLENYQLSTGSYLESKFTTDMEWVFKSATQGSGAEQLNIKRPVVPEGYYRFGDVAFVPGTTPQPALVVKAMNEAILKPPTDYKEVWNDKSTKGEKYAKSSVWHPISPEGYICLGHVWTLDYAKPSTDLIRCIQAKYVESHAYPTLTFSNFAEADLPISLWTVGEAGRKTLAPGTFIVDDCYGCTAPDTRPNEQFFAL
jgi:Vacuolar protein sorting-associated protein 62